ncbi:MAG: 4Fe-4S binding protein [Methanobrevibacter sp.]|jgi:MinD superfamily P-loop ATPase|nr:4Fe-4S binding protein [Candidatus Methanoflexus mossambicus]
MSKVYTIDVKSCAGCGLCASDCQSMAINQDNIEGKFSINSSLCTGCGSCATVCPLNAITVQK